MAIKYVDSNATGADNGDPGNDAWETMLQAVGVAAGTIIYTAHDHSEAGVPTYNFSNSTADDPVVLISVDFDDSYAYRVGASLASTGTSDIILQGHIHVHGFTLDSDDDTVLGTTDNYQVYEDCTFQSDDLFQIGGAESTIVFVNCTINVDDTSQAISAYADNYAIFRGCTITHPNTSVLLGTIGDSTNYLFENCDLSADTDDITAGMGSSSVRSTITLRSCSLASAVDTIGAGSFTAPNSWILIENCSNTTNLTVAELGLSEYIDIFGTVKSDLTRYRAGGADDDENVTAHSWEMAASSRSLELYGVLRTPLIARWVEAGVEVTVTVFVAATSTLQDDEFWIELSGPDNTANPNTTTQGYAETTRLAANRSSAGDVRAAPANITATGESDWTGSDVGTEQSVSITYTPAEAGPLRVRACLAKASTTVYVDPKLVVT